MSGAPADTSGQPPSFAGRGLREARSEPSRATDDRARLFLHAGQVFATASPTRVTTVLGSCVAVCGWDPDSGIGGINHFLLPHWVEGDLSSPRFGNAAVELLVDELVDLGARAERLQCKIFGGAQMMSGNPRHSAGLGTDNADVARKALSALGIPILAEDTGGRTGRKLIFYTDDGSAWVKRL